MRAWKGGVWSLGGQAVNVIVTLGTLAVLGRLLSPAEFGLFGLVLAVHAMARPVLDMGLMPVYLKLERIDNHASNVFFTVNVAVGCVIAGLIFAISPFVAQYYESAALQSLLKVSSLSLLLAALGGQPQAALVRSKRFDLIVKAQTVVLIAGSLLVIGLAWLGYGVWALVWRIVFEAGARFMILALISKSRFRLVGFQEIQHWIHELKFGLEIVGSRLLMGWVGSLDKLILAKFGSLSELGGYSRSQQFALMPDGNIRTSLTTPALAYFGRMRSENKLDNYLLLFWVVFLCAGGPCLILIAQGDLLLPIVLGAQWMEMGWMLQWMGLFGLAKVFQGLSVIYFMDNRMVNQTTFYSALSLVLVLMLPASILYFTGSIYYFVAVFSALSAVFWFVVLARALHVACARYSRKVASVGAFIAMTAGVSTWAAMALRETMMMQPVSELLIASGVQITMCVAMFYLLGREYFDRLKNMALGKQ